MCTIQNTSTYKPLILGPVSIGVNIYWPPSFASPSTERNTKIVLDIMNNLVFIPF